MAELDPIKLPIEGDLSGLSKDLKTAQTEGEKFRQQEIKRFTTAEKKKNKVSRTQLAERLRVIKEAEKTGLSAAQQAEKERLMSMSAFHKKKLAMTKKSAQQEIAINKQAQQQITKDRQKAQAKSQMVTGAVKIGAGVLATKTFIGAVVNLGKESVAATNKLEAMNAIVQKNNMSASEANRILDDLTKDGLVNRTDMAEAIKNLVQFGFTLKEAERFLKDNKDMAIKNRESHFSLSESIVTVTRGLKNNNSILTDATGVSENLSVILKKQGLTMDDLNDKTKEGAVRQAILNKFTEDSSAFHGDAAKEAEKFSGSMAKLNTTLEKVKVEIGAQIGEALQPLIDAFGRGVLALFEWFNSLSDISKKIITVATLIGGLALAMAPLLSGIKSIIAAMKILGVTSTIAAGPLGIIIGLLTALTVGAVLVSEAVADMRKEQEKAFAGDELAVLKKLKEQYSELSKKINKTAEEKEKLAKIEERLIGKVDNFTSATDDNTDAINTNIEAIDAQIDARRRQAQEGGAETEGQAAINEAIRTQKEIERLKRKGPTLKPGSPLFDPGAESQEIEETSKRIKELENRINILRIQARKGGVSFSQFNKELKKHKGQIETIDHANKKAEKTSKRRRRGRRKSIKTVQENTFHLTKLEQRLKSLVDQFDKFRKSTEGKLFPEEGAKRFIERLNEIGDEVFGVMPGIFKELQREFGEIEKKQKQTADEAKRFNNILADRVALVRQEIKALEGKNKKTEEDLKKIRILKEQEKKLLELQERITDNAKQKALSLEFERANLFLSKMNDGVSSFRDGVQAVAEGDAPALVSSLGGIVSVFDKASGGIISMFGNILGAAMDIVEIIKNGSDNLNLWEQQQRELEEIQARRLEKTKAEIQLIRELIKLDQERKNIGLEFLELQVQINEALGIREEIAKAEEAAALTAEAAKIGAAIPGLEGLDLATQEGLIQAADLLTSQRSDAAQLRQAIAMALEIQGSISALSPDQLEEKINNLKNILDPVRDLDLKTGAKVTNSIVHFFSILEQKQELQKAKEMKGDVTGFKATVVATEELELKEMEDFLKKQDLGLDVTADLLAAGEADLVDVISLATKGVAISSDLAVQRVEDIIEAKARKIESAELFVEDEEKKAERILAIETKGLQKIIQEALSAGIDLTDIDLLTKKGFKELLKLIEDPATDEYQKAILLLIKDQVGAVKAAEMTASESANAINTTLEEFAGERGLSLIVDVAQGFLRDSLGIFQTSADAMEDLSLPENLGGISQALATTGKLSVQEQQLESINELVDIQKQALAALGILASTGLGTGIDQEQFNQLLINGLGIIKQGALS